MPPTTHGDVIPYICVLAELPSTSLDNGSGAGHMTKLAGANSSMSYEVRAPGCGIQACYHLGGKKGAVMTTTRRGGLSIKWGLPCDCRESLSPGERR